MAAFGYGEDLIFANFLFWVISLPIYIGGQIVRTSKDKFKKNGFRWVKNYTFIFFVLPLVMNLNGIYMNYKKNTINGEEYIVLELFEADYALIIILVFLVLLRFFNEINRTLLNVHIIGNIILLAGHNYYYFLEYNGIHEEIRLVSSDRKGEKFIIPYDEIESVYVKPYIYTHTRRNRYMMTTTDEYFAWKVFFQTKSQNEVVYDFGLSDSQLDSTIHLREVVTGKKIPFIIEEMDQETLALFNSEVDIHLLNEERYYELFNINK